MNLRYLGHSAFEISTNNSKILVDPFLVKSNDYDYSDVTDIFVTHGHSDHVGKAPKIAIETGAPVTAVFELANHLSKYGISVNGISLGGWVNFDFGRVIALPAFHSSSVENGVYSGCPVGFLFDIDGKRLFHAGDTCLNSEMKVLGEIYKPDVAILPIGGHYTMDIENAVIAAKWIGAGTVIPMHYNTFPQIEVDVDLFEKQILDIGLSPVIMKIDECIEI